jgi:hypothetical protein
MSNVDDAAVATYPALVIEEERSFLTRVMGWMCLGTPADEDRGKRSSARSRSTSTSSTSSCSYCGSSAESAEPCLQANETGIT